LIHIAGSTTVAAFIRRPSPHDFGNSPMTGCADASIADAPEIHVGLRRMVEGVFRRFSTELRNRVIRLKEHIFSCGWFFAHYEKEHRYAHQHQFYTCVYT
jgi:hypothetical protein